ncbi:MAG: prepilin-type N-terminal cleavage/methylation domain-containing protein [Oscillospiraceae bacterium]
MTKSKKGFTLIELIVVLAILAVIAAIAVPTAFGAIDKAKLAADTASVASINSAINMQASILQAGKYEAKDSTLATAITNAKISEVNVQSKSIKLKWTAASTSSVAQLSIDNTNGTLEIKAGEKFVAKIIGTGGFGANAIMDPASVS